MQKEKAFAPSSTVQSEFRNSDEAVKAFFGQQRSPGGELKIQISCKARSKRRSPR